jgi:predicted DNA-binding ribbon-helix-helix protein
MLKKRSFSIAGHRTSVALEPEFWAALEKEAHERSIALATLVARIDAGRSAGRNLASALRVHVLTRALEKPAPAT